LYPYSWGRLSTGSQPAAGRQPVCSRFASVNPHRGLLDEAMAFLQRHLPVAGHIEPGLFERVDAPLFPPVALREALVMT